MTEEENPSAISVWCLSTDFCADYYPAVYNMDYKSFTRIIEWINYTQVDAYNYIQK